MPANSETSGMATTDAAAGQASEWPVVHTDAGEVTLASADALRTRAAEWREWASKATQDAQAWRREADDHFAAAGAIFVGQPMGWMVPPQLQQAVQQAAVLNGRLAGDEQRNAALKEQESDSGFFGRLGARHQQQGVEQDRSRASAELRTVLVPIGRSAPPTSLAAAEGERQAGAALEARAVALEAQVGSAQLRAKDWDAEAERRKDAIKAMGFDSLYEAAVLKTSGPQRVDSPLVLKAGELAYLAVPATLARMVTKTRYVGGSRGFSFPIGHTGIRYRVGSFSGQPVHQQSLTRLDSGTFVVTNQRVAYVGRTKSTSVVLAKVVHIEVYNDALSIAREGKENPDFYLIANPKHAVFLLNWFLAKQSGSD
jgi:hypothetical protein